MLETLNAYIKLHLVVALSIILINLSQIVLSPVISEGIKWVAPGAAARLGPNTRNTATKGAAPEPADPESWKGANGPAPDLAAGGTEAPYHPTGPTYLAGR